LVFVTAHMMLPAFGLAVMEGSWTHPRWTLLAAHRHARDRERREL